MSGSSLIALPVALPLIGAALTLATGRHLPTQRLVGLAVGLASLVAAVALAVRVESQGITTMDLGAWPAPLGITLVADLAASMFLVMSLAVVLLVQVFAIGQGVDRDRPRIFHPVYMTLSAGISISFLTGDLFNLFVGFEVMLMSSYVLLTLGAGREQIRAGMTYVVINLLASTIFVSAVGLVYAATGTINMADLVVKFGELPEATQTALGILLLSVFATKAAVFPFFFWLPDSYPTAPTSVTAVFAGLLTKVGVYTMLRTTTVLDLDQLSFLLLWAAATSMILGGIGAVAQSDMKRILSFHIVSQVGYMVMGIGILTPAAIAATVLYVLHQIPVKTALFMVTGLVEHSTGTGALHRLGGLIRRAPVFAALFAVSALSLAGMPPFSGFVAKLALVASGVAAAQWWVVAASLVAAVFTVLSMNKIWAGVFWGNPDDPPPALEHVDGPRLRAPALMVWSTVGVVALSLVIPVFAGPIYELSERAAASLLDPASYAAAVLGGAP